MLRGWKGCWGDRLASSAQLKAYRHEEKEQRLYLHLLPNRLNGRERAGGRETNSSHAGT